jgi:hypothetical protein
VTSSAPANDDLVAAIDNAAAEVGLPHGVDPERADRQRGLLATALGADPDSRFALALGGTHAFSAHGLPDVGGSKLCMLVTDNFDDEAIVGQIEEELRRAWEFHRLESRNVLPRSDGTLAQWAVRPLAGGDWDFLEISRESRSHLPVRSEVPGLRGDCMVLDLEDLIAAQVARFGDRSTPADCYLTYLIREHYPDYSPGHLMILAQPHNPRLRPESYRSAAERVKNLPASWFASGGVAVSPAEVQPMKDQFAYLERIFEAIGPGRHRYATQPRSARRGQTGTDRSQAHQNVLGG